MPSRDRKGGLSLARILLACLAPVLFASCASHGQLRSASGIVRDGSDLLIVGDNSSGTVFRYRLQTEDMPAGDGPLLAEIEIDSAAVERFGKEKAIDLESIDLLPDGRIVVLSEKLHALFSKDVMIAFYPYSMAGIGGRGMEGLAIRSDGQVAGLWEGGYFTPEYLPTWIEDVGELTAGPMRPLLCVHTIPATSDIRVCWRGEGAKALQVPVTPDASQSFRATDLVWSADGQSLLVLLSSLDATSTIFRYKWLQRFSVDGDPIGEPLNLCGRGYLPAHLRSGKGGNYEGLGWFEPGKSLVIINDYSEAATAVIIAVDPWQPNDKMLACDQALPSE